MLVKNGLGYSGEINDHLVEDACVWHRGKKADEKLGENVMSLCF